MCCDRSPAVFSQRYNFPSEQVWRQLPRLAPSLSPSSQRRYSSLREVRSCTFAEIDYLCIG